MIVRSEPGWRRRVGGQLVARLVDVDADADDDGAVGELGEDAGDLAPVQHHVVRPLDLRGEPGRVLDRLRGAASAATSESSGSLALRRWMEQDRDEHGASRRRLPAAAEPAASRRSGGRWPRPRPRAGPSRGAGAASTRTPARRRYGSRSGRGGAARRRVGASAAAVTPPLDADGADLVLGRADQRVADVVREPVHLLLGEVERHPDEPGVDAVGDRAPRLERRRAARRAAPSRPSASPSVDASSAEISKNGSSCLSVIPDSRIVIVAEL